jgi:hypothetical protein
MRVKIMKEIRHRQQGGNPEIEYSEIYIPNDKDLGTGTFTTVLKINALLKNNPIISIMINIPIFQISVNINPQTREIPVLLGKADGTDPISKKIFLISPEDMARNRIYVASFKNWEITDLSANGIELKEKKM